MFLKSFVCSMLLVGCSLQAGTVFSLGQDKNNEELRQEIENKERDQKILNKILQRVNGKLEAIKKYCDIDDRIKNFDSLGISKIKSEILVAERKVDLDNINSELARFVLDPRYLSQDRYRQLQKEKESAEVDLKFLQLMYRLTKSNLEIKNCDRENEEWKQACREGIVRKLKDCSLSVLEAMGKYANINNLIEEVDINNFDLVFYKGILDVIDSELAAINNLPGDKAAIQRESLLRDRDKTQLQINIATCFCKHKLGSK